MKRVRPKVHGVQTPADDLLDSAPAFGAALCRFAMAPRALECCCQTATRMLHRKGPCTSGNVCTAAVCAQPRTRSSSKQQQQVTQRHIDTSLQAHPATQEHGCQQHVLLLRRQVAVLPQHSQALRTRLIHDQGGCHADVEAVHKGGLQKARRLSSLHWCVEGRALLAGARGSWSAVPPLAHCTTRQSELCLELNVDGLRPAQECPPGTGSCLHGDGDDQVSMLHSFRRDTCRQT